MDVLASILRILIPSIRHILSYDSPILLSWSDADSLGKTI